MENKYTNEDIEFASRLISRPDQFQEQEVILWLSDANHRKLLEEMRRCREAGWLELEQVNVIGEWDRFKSKSIKQRRNLRLSFWIWSGGIAVAVLIGLLVLPFLRERGMEEEGRLELALVQKRHHESQKVCIVTSEGKEILLSTEPGKECLDKGVKTVLADSISGIDYAEIRRDTNYSIYHTLKVPQGGEYFIRLEDSTQIWLNSDTELRYPVKFAADGREVELIKGEAYFKVSRDEKRPFTVTTEKLKTRVLGTEFNIQAYPDKSNVTLVKGSVGVRGIQATTWDVVLRPGENAALIDQEIVVSEVDVQNYVAWKDGYFYYDNVRLEDILEELGAWFDFTVSYQSMALKDYRFKFWTNRKDSPENIVERLNNLSELDIQWKDRRVVVSKK